MTQSTAPVVFALDPDRSLAGAVAGALAFVTWAWAYDAQLLSPDLRQAIEVLREALR